MLVLAGEEVRGQQRQQSLNEGQHLLVPGHVAHRHLALTPAVTAIRHALWGCCGVRVCVVRWVGTTCVLGIWYVYMWICVCVQCVLEVVILIHMDNYCYYYNYLRIMVIIINNRLNKILKTIKTHNNNNKQINNNKIMIINNNGSTLTSMKSGSPRRTRSAY